ncbi:methylenetetrahydrofolate reductase [NAD(P)H] [Fusibacter paucivorans]|uniref:Methylenetetrahydrofolate reductase n=1 Tax=Fusibacter paucivorans TaxID=76009 RepID=A0ABS5PT32_9FIRM|nr:methylenetetrahydrofolate reductase [NAD(P)H] [Fusibacter paucivorans]MBS7527716.1 methylenetetrahydrofolate reductase [NAD(P)H] [Fusibacter paucivorans]
MDIKTIFNKKKPVLSFEIFPPKRDGDLNSVYKTIDALAMLDPDYISVTYGAAGSERSNTTLDIAAFIRKQYQIESLAHLTCVSSSKDDVDRIFDKFEAAEIENILALRGDLPEGMATNNRAFQYAGDLIQYIKETRNFTVGAACYPEGHIEAKSRTVDLINLKQKTAQGADFLVTQLFFDNEKFYDFRREVRALDIDIPITAGIMPVLNKNQIERMVALSGASLPDKFKRIMSKYEFNPQALHDAGIIYASEQLVDLLSTGVDGIHLYVMNKPEVAKQLVDNVSNVLKALRSS